MFPEKFRPLRRALFCLILLIAITRWAPCLDARQSNGSNEPKLRSLWTRKTGTDWPTFLGPLADGKSPETGILKDWTGEKLKILWQVDVGEGYGIGSVAAGRYFHFDRHQGNARVRCLNAETGQPLWEFQYESNYQDLYGYDSGPRASPVIEAERLYVFGVEGMLYCLNAETGQEIWKLNTAKDFGVIQNFFGVASTPVIYQNLLLVMVGGSPEASKLVPPGALDRVQPNGAAVIALNKLTGELVYQLGDDLASYSTIRIGQVDGRDLGLAWMRDKLIGFLPEDGRQLFEFPWRARKLESVNASTPVLQDDLLFLSECYELGGVLLELNNGQPIVKWSDKDRPQKSLATHWSTPVLDDGMLYGCSGRHSSNAELRCVEWLTGKVRWSENRFTRCSLTGIDGHLVVLDEQGQLVLIKATPEKYQQVTAFDGGPKKLRFKPPCWAAPVISHGLMFVRGKDQLVCFDLIPVAD